MPADICKFLSNQPRHPTANLDPEHAASSSVHDVNLYPEHTATPPATELAAQCKLPCCDTTSPTPARLNVDKERTAQGVGKRKRFLNPEWLDQFKWLVLCNTTANGYCHISYLPLCHHYQEKLTLLFEVWKDCLHDQRLHKLEEGEKKFATHQQSEFHRGCLLKQLN